MVLKHMAWTMGLWLVATVVHASTNAPTVLPNVILPDQAGRYVRLNDFAYPGLDLPRKPRSVLVLNFMASNCKPCFEELPVLLRVWRQEGKPRGVRLFLISVDSFEQREALDRMLTPLQLDCGVLLDPYRKTAEKFGVEGIPRTFVISDTGGVVAEMGGSTNFVNELLDALGIGLENK